MSENTKRVALIPCPNCGEQTELRRGAKKGRLYVVCTPPDGCGMQLFSRSLAACKRLAGKANHWTCPETRAALIGAPAAAPAPAPAPEKTTTTKPKEKASSWLDMTL